MVDTFVLWLKELRKEISPAESEILNQRREKSPNLDLALYSKLDQLKRQHLKKERVNLNQPLDLTWANSLNEFATKTLIVKDEKVELPVNLADRLFVYFLLIGIFVSLIPPAYIYYPRIIIDGSIQINSNSCQTFELVPGFYLLDNPDLSNDILIDLTGNLTCQTYYKNRFMGLFPGLGGCRYIYYDIDLIHCLFESKQCVITVHQTAEIELCNIKPVPISLTFKLTRNFSFNYLREYVFFWWFCNIVQDPKQIRIH